MSKPDKPGELQNVKVKAISLVSKAANQQKFKILKSADTVPDEQITTKDERGLFQILKNFFTSDKVEIKKGEVKDNFNARENGEKISNAYNSLIKVLGISRYYDENSNPETDPAKIVTAIDDFRNLALEILLPSQSVQKSGRKISGSRLTKLKNIQTMLNEILSDIDENKEDTEQVSKEELIKSVNDALKPITERIENLEKADKPAEDTKQPEPPIATEPTVSMSEEIQKAVAEAIKPLSERLEKVEKARGFSNKVPEDTNVQKNAEDFWGQIF